MSNYDKVLTKVSDDPKVKNLGIRPEMIKRILDIYNKSVIGVLVTEGFVDVDEYCRIEVVKTQARVHVLRGKEYQSTRTYKLRAHMQDSMYKMVEESYALLE